MIAIVDYGVGNIRAFANIYKKLNVPFKIAQKKEDLYDAAKLILPGVGAFDHAMEKLERSGMRQCLDQLVLEARVPVIGICVGMQMLAKSSEEGDLPGLGWIDGVVRKFDENKIRFATHLPHMGWNDIKPVKPSQILMGLESNAKFYFLHSYYFHCSHPDDTIAVADYGCEFSCAVNKNNIYGVQFHPEKSHQYGIQLLENFSKI
ncbi:MULTISPECIES: imidazole glycerol phosphate synthase subunit HisH [Pseudomonadati]|uniref:Imidazole glycerol phosphate synthase subunit HisH n=1 Tax=Arcticibacter tournemirensis TaxID=699437 RepID=A0A4Q0M7U1_9SPHI|nr:imidazole glycerol phosphate synthase subunit HisH [Arcticibacter tournemirensis]RXF69124.1 imidazole glycerol phosphate synthase subunit HisH [Arcticibacter tournemirensis]